jgi:hypothetical protein
MTAILTAIILAAKVTLGVLPDPQLTPGVKDPAVTQANIHQTICVPGYTAKVRNVPASVKHKVVAAYRKKWPNWPACKPGACEIDHLISLELGGANDADNLWPESYDPPDTGARAKDVIETKLHRMVCSGQITLEEAQARIVTDWTTALDKK